MSLVSKPYIFDLTPGQSFVEHLVRAGFDVYLVDWGTPRAEHRGAEDRRLRGRPAARLHRAGAAALRRIDEVTLLGYCLGGIFTALYAAMEPTGPLKNLLQLATPVNGEGMELQRQLLTSEGLDPDLIVDTLGNVPSSMIEGAFQMLRPLQKASGQAQLLNNADDPRVRQGAPAHRALGRRRAAVPRRGVPAARARLRRRQQDRRAASSRSAAARCDLRDIRVPVLHVRRRARPRRALLRPRATSCGWSAAATRRNGSSRAAT